MFTFPGFAHSRSFAGLILSVLICDQASKEWALANLFAPSRQITVLPFFDLTPVWNPGISFGLFAEIPAVMSTAIPVFATLVVIWLYFQLPSLTAIQRVGAGLISGGALGNVIDRLRFGRVVDFIDVHLFSYHWPAFNIADSAIFVGVVAWLYGIMSAPNPEGE